MKNTIKLVKPIIQAIIVILGVSLIIFVSGIILFLWGDVDTQYLPYADIQLINSIYILGHFTMMLFFMAFLAIPIGILIFGLCSDVEDLLGEED